jgi:hypothetical protein
MKKFEQFAEQAYSSKAQIDESLLGLGAKAIQYGTKAFKVVKRLFSKGKPKPIPAGDIGAIRLRQGQATDAVNRLNKSTAVSKANDATRSATRETNRLNNLDPRAVSDANKRREASQVIQRNLEKGRPSFAGPQPVDRLDYKPGDPMFTDHLKDYYASKRRGARGLPK